MVKESPSTLPSPLGVHYLDGLIKRMIVTRSPDVFQELSGLSPKDKAYLATTKEFHVLVLSMVVDAIIGVDNLTRGQWKAVAWFKNQGMISTTAEVDEALEVEAASGKDSD